jgi:hypothetical protein
VMRERCSRVVSVAAIARRYRVRTLLLSTPVAAPSIALDSLSALHGRVDPCMPRRECDDWSMDGWRVQELLQRLSLKRQASGVTVVLHTSDTQRVTAVSSPRVMEPTAEQKRAQLRHAVRCLRERGLYQVPRHDAHTVVRIWAPTRHLLHLLHLLLGST